MVRQRFKPFQKAKQAKDFWDNAQEPQSGLVPLFNSPFYATPNEPADPMDCNRYPDSPYCGGNPLTAKFAPSIEVSMVRDECNLGIQFDGSFAFIKVPPVQIVYRNPSCIPPPPAFPIPPIKRETIEPLTIPDVTCNNGRQPVYIVFRAIREDYRDFPYPEDWFDIIELIELLGVTFRENGNVKVDFRFTYKSFGGQKDNPVIETREDSFNISYPVTDTRVKRLDNNVFLVRGFYSFTALIGLGTFPVRRNDFSFYNSSYGYEEYLEQNRYIYTENPSPYTITTSQRTYTVTPVKGFDTFYGTQWRYTTTSVFIEKRQYASLAFCEDWHGLQPPPLPPKKMCCCPNVEQNDQLLKLILKRIGEPKEVTIFDEDLNRKGAQKAKKKPQSLNEFLKLAVERTEIVSRIIGIENFPVTVPDTVIEPHKEGTFAKIFGFIDGTKKRKISTLTEFVAWMSEQDSAVLGEFHQVVEFETGEKDKKGKPITSTVVLPNIAETLKEITILVTQSAKQNNVQTELIFKIAMEVVAARAAAHKASLIAADIQDYLDYPTQTVTGTIPTSVKPPYVVQNGKGQFEVTETNEDYKEFLKPGSVSFSYDDWTGDSSLRDHLMDLLQMASMLRAILYQRTDK